MSSRTVHRPRHKASKPPRRRATRVVGAAASAAIVAVTASGLAAGVGHADPVPPTTTSPSQQPGTGGDGQQPGTGEGEGGQPGTVPSGPEGGDGTNSTEPEDQPGTEDPSNPETAPSGHDDPAPPPAERPTPDDAPAPEPEAGPSDIPPPGTLAPEAGPKSDQRAPRPAPPKDQFVAHAPGVAVNVPAGSGVPDVSYVVKHNGDVAYDGGTIAGVRVRGGWTAEQADAPLRVLGPAAPQARKAINDMTRDLTSRAERALPGVHVEWPQNAAKKKRVAPRHSR